MDISKLAAPFPPDVVSWRVGPTTKNKDKGMALAYIDARDVQDRLSEVCGPFGWQCRHEVSGDKRVTCHIGIQNPETGEWIWRSDGAGETDVDGEKGSYSDSFKRAAVKWGIGRYLYDLDSPWVAIEAHGRSFSITASEMKRLAGALKNVPAAQPAAPSASFIELRETLASIVTDNGLADWAARVKRGQDDGLISPDERQSLIDRYKARAAYIEQLKKAAPDTRSSDAPANILAAG